MSTPPLNAVDVGALTNPTPLLTDIDIGALGGPINQARLEFSASGTGIGPVSAEGNATLNLSASGTGYWVDLGQGSASLGIAASGQAVMGFAGSGSPSLSLSADGSGYQDWVAMLSPLQMQEVYRLIVTGETDGLDDLVIGAISSWQATSQAGGRSSYLQAVIPAADQYLDAISARSNGELVIEKGYRVTGAPTRYDEIMRSRFDELRPDRGGRALTITVSGYLAGKQLSNGNRTLTGVRSISSQNAKRRVRCDIDLFLRPGMTVTALYESFKADYINYYVNRNDKFCEVGER